MVLVVELVCALKGGGRSVAAARALDLVYGYTKYYALHRIFAPKVENALVIGGGAYSIPKALAAELPEAAIDVSEIEPSLFLSMDLNMLSAPEASDGLALEDLSPAATAANGSAKAVTTTTAIKLLFI